MKRIVRFVSECHKATMTQRKAGSQNSHTYFHYCDYCGEPTKPINWIMQRKFLWW